MPRRASARKRKLSPIRPAPNKKLRSSSKPIKYIVISDSEDEDDDCMAIDFNTQCALAPSSGRVDDIFRNELPLEIHQKIAEHLPEDADVRHYASICKSSYASISISVWRKRYVTTFDATEGETPEKLMKKYLFRRKITRNQIIFDVVPHRRYLEVMGQEDINLENQEWCLKLLRELILESDASMGYDEAGNAVVLGLNLQFIKELIDWHWPNVTGKGRTDLMASFLNIGSPLALAEIDSASADGILPFVMIVQLCLTSFLIRPDSCNGTAVHFDDSQRQAYMCRTEEPLFRGLYMQHLNVRWLLNVVNFFKLHLKASNEGLFYNVYSDLMPDQLPQHWLGKIKPGTQKLGSHWKGAYTFMDENDLISMRSQSDHDDPYMDDINDGHELLQDLTVFFDETKFPSTKWPSQWQTFLRSDPFKDLPGIDLEGKTTRTTRSRRQKDQSKPPTPELKHFFGSGVDGKMSHFYGCLHAIPAQQEIYGFQRVTMMKFFPDENGDYDANQVWAYEGCVLPGGRIILGRWWAVRDELMGSRIPLTGPFIFWNVDISDAEVLVTGSEALDFLDGINDPLIMGGFQ